MTQILGTDKQSVCMYCNQTAYGRGCVYSPSKVHVHIDDPKRCIYCGQLAFGGGCPYNPTGGVHVHGVEFNTMMKESVEQGLIATILMNRMSQPINETAAYKLGLIDETGMTIKSPESFVEHQALTPVDYYIFKLRRMIGETRLSLMNTTVLMEKVTSNYEDIFNPKIYEAEMELKQQVIELAEDYKNILAAAFDKSIPIERVENMLFEEIISDE